MSFLGDAVQTLNEDIEVASFLPGINYVFLLISPSDRSELFFGLALVAAIVGAALFNHLRSLKSTEDTDIDNIDTNEQNEESKEWKDPRDTDSSQSENNQIGQKFASMLLFLPWGALLLLSMYFLFERFSKDWILPEVLFFISTGFLALYTTDIVLKRFVNDYNG